MKRTIALLLALVFCFCLAACGNSTESTTTTAASDETTSTDTQTATETETATVEATEDEQETAEDTPASTQDDATENVTSGSTRTGSGAAYTEDGYTLPLFDEGIEFTSWISFSTSDMNLFGDDGYNANLAVQEVTEKTGVSISWRMVTSDTNSEQFSLMLAGGDYTDLVSDASSAYTGDLSEAIDEDIFVDIKPYMEDCMPFFTEAYNTLEDDEKRLIVTTENQIPGTTGISDYNDAAGAGFFVRTDYLEAVGMEIPKTYDELYKVLTAFKSELDLEQPLMLPSAIVPSSNSLCAGYDVLGTFAIEGMVASPWYQVDGTVKFGIVEEGYYSYLSMITAWYEEGLISSEFVEKNNNPMGSDYIGVITSGEAGFFYGENELVTQYMEGATTNDTFEIQPISEIVQEEGQITHFINNASRVDGKITAVTTACPDIEKALTYLDYFYSPDGKLYGNMGVEGISYEWVGDEAVYLDSFLNNEVYNDKERNCIYLFKGFTFLGMDVPDTYSYDIQYSAEEIWIANDDGAYILPSISLTPDERDTYSRIYSDISTYMAENLTKIVVGDKDIADWDSFIDTLYEMGIQELIDIYQTALDRFYELEV